MVKALVFDCFGVLVRDGWLPFCERHFGHDPGRLGQAHSISRAMNSGHIGIKEFIAELADLTGNDPAAVAKEINQNPANEELFAWMREWKPAYKIGLLSNAGENWLEDLFGKDNAELFDGVVLSYEIGAIKPDVRMYEAIAGRLGVEPSECLFIDDQERYCEGARAASMKAICYEDNIQLKNELKKYNVFLQNA